ncbi:hypothetical protein GT025_21740 [Streptomyces sp. SID4920]|nr:hypothetical protein [Streptomyces sp. SID4920]MYX69212.1 hypothetical protein [Streptomyces sp. SID8373]
MSSDGGAGLGLPAFSSKGECRARGTFDAFVLIQVEGEREVGLMTVLKTTAMRSARTALMSRATV